MKVNEFTTLGRTGLRVTPLCMGAMSFGTGWGWGADEKGSKALFDLYLERGGNFIDSADGYQGGQSEEMTGKFINGRGLRDQVVLAGGQEHLSGKILRIAHMGCCEVRDLFTALNCLQVRLQELGFHTSKLKEGGAAR